MPRLKKRANRVQSSKEDDFDSSRIVSKETSDRFIKSMKKNFILEWDFKPKIGLEDHFVEMLKTEHLEKQAKEPEKALTSIVQEFYTNLKEHRNYKVFVRFVWVPFNAKAIYDYLDMPCTINDQYTQYLSNMTLEKNVRLLQS